MRHADFAALLAELPGPIAACLARCRVAAMGRHRVRMRHAPVERLAELAADSREAIALARLYRSGPVDVSGVVFHVAEDTGPGTVLRRWTRSGVGPFWPSIPESMDVRVYRYQRDQLFVEMVFGIADVGRSQFVRHMFVANIAHAERTACRWAACAAAVLAVRPYLPETEEVT